jgi:hypothetical protein
MIFERDINFIISNSNNSEHDTLVLIINREHLAVLLIWNTDVWDLPCRDWVAQTTDLFLIVLSARKSRIKSDLVYGKGPVLGLFLGSLGVSSHCGERQWALLTFLIQTLIPSRGLYPHDPITSQRPISLYITLELRLQIRTLWDTSIWSITEYIAYHFPAMYEEMRSLIAKAAGPFTEAYNHPVLQISRPQLLHC